MCILLQMWFGECPLAPGPLLPGDPVSYVGLLVNWGAEHSLMHTSQVLPHRALSLSHRALSLSHSHGLMHTSQAMRCWMHAQVSAATARSLSPNDTPALHPLCRA